MANGATKHLGLGLAVLTAAMSLAAFGALARGLATSQRVAAALAVEPPAAGEAARPDEKNAGRPNAGRSGGQPPSLPEATEKLLKDHPLFGAPPEQQPQLQSILGNSAQISGNWIDVGQEQNGVKLLEVSPFKAVIEFNGQRRELTLWNDLPGANGGGGGGSPSPPMPSSPPPGRPASPRSAPPPGAMSGRVMEAPGAMSGANLPPEVPEQMAKARAEAMARRQELMQQMEERRARQIQGN